MQETQETLARFLGWEDTLEKEMTTYSSFLAWEIPWTEEHSELQSMGSRESDTSLRLNHHEAWPFLPLSQAWVEEEGVLETPI